MSRLDSHEQYLFISAELEKEKEKLFEEGQLFLNNPSKIQTLAKQLCVPKSELRYRIEKLYSEENLNKIKLQKLQEIEAFPSYYDFLQSKKNQIELISIEDFMNSWAYDPSLQGRNWFLYYTGYTLAGLAALAILATPVILGAAIISTLIGLNISFAGILSLGGYLGLTIPIGAVAGILITLSDRDADWIYTGTNWPHKKERALSTDEYLVK